MTDETDTCGYTQEAQRAADLDRAIADAASTAWQDEYAEWCDSLPPDLAAGRATEVVPAAAVTRATRTALAGLFGE